MTYVYTVAYAGDGWGLGLRESNYSLSAATVRLSPKNNSNVGWGATAPLRFPDLKQVAFEELNPTYSKVC